MRVCANCGMENDDNAKFCINCGAPIEAQSLSSPASPPASPPSLGQQFLYDVRHIPSRHRMHPVVLLGYIFGFLGGLIGILLGYYLYTRQDPDLKIHGRIILTLSTFMMFIWILLYSL